MQTRAWHHSFHSKIIVAILIFIFSALYAFTLNYNYRLAFLLPFFIFLLLIACHRIDYLCYLYIVFIPFEHLLLMKEMEFLTISKFLLFVGLLFLLIHATLRGRRFLKGSFEPIYLFFLLSLLISIPSSLNISNSNMRLILFLGFYLQFFFLINTITCFPNIFGLSMVLILSAFILSIIGFKHYLIIPHAERATSLFHDPNYFANLIVTVIPISAVIFLQKQKFFRLFNLLIFAILNSMLFFTFSRSAWLSISIVYIIMFIIFHTREKAVWYLPLILLLLFLLIPDDILVKAVERISKLDYSSLTRIQLWQAALKMIKDHPFTGIGLANFKLAYPHYCFRYSFYQGEIYAHNSYLELWAEVGSISFALFFLLLLKTVSNYYLSLRRLQAYKEKYYLCAGFFLATIANFLQAFFFSFEHLKYFWSWIAFSYIWRNISES